VPAKGLAAGGLTLTNRIHLPGVLLAGLAGLGFGLVLGPEGPLLALGSGLAVLAIRLARREMEPPVLAVIAAAGSVAALSFVFDSPLIAAVNPDRGGRDRRRADAARAAARAARRRDRHAGLDRNGVIHRTEQPRLRARSAAAARYGHPDIAQFGWTVALAIAVAVLTRPIMLGGLSTHRLVMRRIVLLLPIVGLIISGLAIAFHRATGNSVNDVLFSGQDALPGLLTQAGTWSLGALALVIVFKGLVYMLSLGSFRGGPVSPALFLAAAGRIMASRLPGFTLTPVVAVGMGAAIAAVLRLPLTAVVLATPLTANAGTGDEPLIIVGVVVSYLVTLRLSAPAPAVAPA
jgi:H+/Cl- antiporter ClcA